MEVLPSTTLSLIASHLATLAHTPAPFIAFGDDSHWWWDHEWHATLPPDTMERTSVSVALPSTGEPLLTISIRDRGPAVATGAWDEAPWPSAVAMATTLLQGYFDMAALEERSAAIRATIERMGDAYVTLDDEWRYIAANAQALALLGRDRAALIGERIWDVFPDLLGTSFEHSYRRAVREQTAQRVEGYFAPLSRWFETRAYPGPDGLTIFFTDRTELHRTSEALSASAARLRLAVQASGTGLWDWDLLTNEVYYSPEWKRQLGYEDHELPNRWEEFESRLHPDDGPPLLSNARRYIEQPDGDYEAEFRLRHRDGSYRWILVRGAVLFDQAGRPVRMLGSHVDLTERKETELELGRSRAALRQLSSDLLLTRERERADVAREIHDELGQALTALKLDVAWLRRQLPVAASPDSAARLAGMSDALDQTVQAVRRISGELRPRLLDDLGLEAALEWQAESFTSRSDVPCRTDIRLPSQPPSDIAIALFRITQESLTNVTRHAQASQVVLRLALDHGDWLLTIADDGRGMPVDSMAGPGSGLLGMRERAHLVGGQLAIDSAPGQGTTIHVRVPDRPHPDPSAGILHE